MADRVRVTVAPGAHISITPHPSGMAVLGPLILFGGNTADVPAERAAALYAAGLILHPVTGAMPPAPEAMATTTGPTVSFDGGRPRRTDDPLQAWPSWSATAAIKAPEPGIPPDRNAPRSAVTYHDAIGDRATISVADGQIWPNY